MINKQLYQEVLARLRDALRRKRPELWENQTWMLHHDNAPAHASLLICSYLAKHQTSVVSHLPYSPDLAPADFFLFPKIITIFKRRRFQTIEEIPETDEQLVHVLSSAGVAGRLMLIAKRDKWHLCQNLTLGVLSSRNVLSMLVAHYL